MNTALLEVPSERIEQTKRLSHILNDAWAVQKHLTAILKELGDMTVRAEALQIKMKKLHDSDDGVLETAQEADELEIELAMLLTTLEFGVRCLNNRQHNMECFGDLLDQLPV